MFKSLLIPIILSVFILEGSVLVAYHNSQPVISIEKTPDSVITSERIEISGHLSPTVREYHIKLNGRFETKNYVDKSDNKFSNIIELDKGANTLVIKAKEQNGSETSIVIQVTRQ